MKAINNVLTCKISRFKLNIGQLRPRHTMRQIAATRRRDRLLQQIASCDVKIIVATTEFCHCDLLHKFKPCDRSQQQNKRKQPFRSVCMHLRQVAVTKFKSTDEGSSIRDLPC